MDELLMRKYLLPPVTSDSGLLTEEAEFRRKRRLAQKARDSSWWKRHKSALPALVGGIGISIYNHHQNKPDNTQG